MGFEEGALGRREILRTFAAAGLGAAITATAATRGLLPFSREPTGPTGDEPVPLPDRLDALFNVRDHGALGDGLADDTKALIDTIDRVPASGGIVYLPRGTYRVTSGVAAARTNVWLLGAGAGATTLRLGDRANASVVGVEGSGWTISDLAIDGNGTNQDGWMPNGISICAGPVGGPVEGVAVRRVRVVGTRAAGIKSIPAGAAARNARILIEDCVVEDAGAEGIFLVDTDASTVARCLVSRTGNHGIIAKGGDGNVIEGNRVERAGFAKTGGFAHGIAMDGDGGNRPNRRHQIRNNQVLASYDCGIEVADGVNDVLIEGNAVDGSGVGALPVGTAGIYFGGGLAPSTRAMIRGNAVAHAKSQGICVDSPDAGRRTSVVGIEGNLCRANGDGGIIIRWAQGFLISDNTCLDNEGMGGGDGIRLEEVANGTVLGNRATDDRTTSKLQAYGLRAVTGAQDILVAWNDFVGNAIAAIGGVEFFAGASRIEGNVGFNPQGVATITVGPSPFTYRNQDHVREAVYIRGGTVTDISKDATTIFTGSPATVWLEPGESVTVAYAAAPTMLRDRK